MDKDRLVAAIRSSWSQATSADSNIWTTDNPSRGQCDVTSLVVLEYLGGDLQLARVYLDGKHVEHHYWNQLSDHEEMDLTRGQFPDDYVIAEPDRVSQDFIRTNYPTIRQELRERHDRLRRAVADKVGPPLGLLGPQRGPSPARRVEAS